MTDEVEQHPSEPGEARLGRRRRANARGGRRKTFQVKVTPEEAVRLQVMADQAGVSVQRLMVESAFSEGRETITDRREKAGELFAVRRHLGALSNNLNQIAKVANATGEVQDELHSTAAAVRALIPRVEEAVEAIIRANG